MDFDKMFNGDADYIDMDAIDEGAKQLFKIYSSFVTAGFTPDQAMSIILTMITHGLSS